MSLSESYRHLLVQHLWQARGEGFRLLFAVLAFHETDQLSALLRAAKQKVPNKLPNLRLTDLAYVKRQLGKEAYQDLLSLVEQHHNDVPAPGPRFGPPKDFPELLKATYCQDEDLAWNMLEAATQEEAAHLGEELVAAMLQDQNQQRRRAILRRLGGSPPSR